MGTGMQLIEELRFDRGTIYPAEHEWNATVDEVAAACDAAKDRLRGACWDDWRLLERVGRAMKSGDLQATLAAIAAWRAEWMGFIGRRGNLS